MSDLYSIQTNFPESNKVSKQEFINKVLQPILKWSKTS